MSDDEPRILHTVKGEPGRRLFWCPGCECAHGWNEGWTWDGNEEAPTVSPSLAIQGQVRCHLLVQAGKLVFLSDCEHALAGKTVPMEPF